MTDIEEKLNKYCLQRYGIPLPSFDWSKASKWIDPVSLLDPESLEPLDIPGVKNEKDIGDKSR